MSVSLANVGSHLLASRSLLGRRQAQVGIAVSAVSIILSIVLAPGVAPTLWDWTRIVIIGVVGGGSILMFASAQVLATGAAERQPRLLLAAALVGLALLLNLTFSFGAALAFSLGFTTVAIIATADSAYRTTRTIAGALIATIPLWVWSALAAWTWELTLLAPLAAIGVISDGHMRTALGQVASQGSRLSPRAHRLACWLGILGSALIALIAGLPGDASNGVIALGAIGAILLVAIEAGTPPSSPASIAIADAALLWVTFCWVVSL